ncbi:MAG: hypothetical protein KC616_05340 [Myxococcales bacterium]|nr:hypothetical protein [Myxococcales bacterium]
MTDPRSQIRLREALLEPLPRLHSLPLVLVAAPGGYGKSTLLAAWCEALREQGQVVASLALSPLHEDPGLFVEDLVEALREGLGERGGSTTDPGGDAFGSDLLRRVPALAAESLPGRDGGTAGARLGRWLRHSLVDTGERITLLLDDYHLLREGGVADGLIDALLVGPEAGDGIGLVIATRGRAPRTAARVVAEGRALELGVPDLSLRADQVEALITRRLPDVGARNELVPLVLARTGGWAMGVLLATRALARRADEDPRRVLAEIDRGDALFVPLAEDLLGYEPAQTIELLETAAMVGPIDRETLVRAFGDGMEAGRSLDEAIEKGLIEGSAARLAPHPLWQDLVLARLQGRAPAPERSARVSRCARVLEAAGEAPRAAELCARFGSRDELARLLEIHGLDWVERGQHANVARWLEMARAPDEERADFHLLEGLLGARHDPGAALVALERAALLFHRSGRHDRELATLHNIVIVAGNTGRIEQTRAAVLRLMGLRRLLTSSEARGVALLFAGMAAFQRSRFRIARRLIDRASAYALGPRERGAVGMGQAQLAYLDGRWKPGLEAVEVLLADPSQRRHGPSFFTLRMLRALGRGVLGVDRTRALTQLRTTRAALEELRMPLTEAECAYHTSRLLLADGRPGEARAELDGTLERFTAIGEEDGRTAACSLLAQACWLQGDRDAARAHARRALESFANTHRIGRLRFRAYSAALAARVLAELGDTSEADRFAKRYARTLEVPDAAACQHLVQLALARVAWLAGDAARARRQVARGLALAETLDGPVPELDRALAAWALAPDAVGETAASAPPPQTPARMALRIVSLGGLGVELDGRPIDPARWRGNTARRLLLRLLCAGGRPIERERLATELWPDLEPARARGNLRVALTRLRRALEPEREAGEPEAWLALEGSAVALSEAALATWDVQVFRDRVAAAHRALRDGNGDRAIGIACEAFAVYCGPFSPDAYDEWVLDLRARLEEELLALGRDAIPVALERCPERAGELAQHLIDHVPADEQAWLLLARSWLARGDRAAALRTTRRAEEVLRRELDLEASAELRALAASARSSA